VRFRRRSNLRRIGLGFPEVALVEVLRDWPGFSDASWEELVTATHHLVERGVVDIERVEWAIRGERSTTARLNSERLHRDLSPPRPLPAP
jgi:hypothetical protein